MHQQRELRGLGVRARAVNALSRVFLCVFWHSSVLRFRLVFFNQESLLFWSMTWPGFILTSRLRGFQPAQVDIYLARVS